MNVMLGIYTCKAKQYCDEELIERIKTLDPAPSQIMIVDNSINTKSYAERLRQLTKDIGIPCYIEHIDICTEDRGSYAQRAIAESANAIREVFLALGCDALMILESDVLPKQDNTIELLAENIEQYAGIGGIYYKNYHKPEWFDDGNKELVELTDQSLLSGCTMYRRDVIDMFEFRWCRDNMAAFPDAWMNLDIGSIGFKLANDCRVKCDHIEITNGNRGWGEVWQAIY